MYLAQSTICEEARCDKRKIMIGGDFNAEPGNNKLAKWDDPLGKHGLEKRNARGEWLATWAETNGLIIGNTHFKKRFGLKYTHTGTTGNKRMIDFILISRGAWHNVRDAYSTGKVSLGSDHRAIVLEMQIIGAMARRKYCEKKRGVQKSWAPDNPTKFKELVDDYLPGCAEDGTQDDKHDMEINTPILEACNHIEKALTEAAWHCDQAINKIEVDQTKNRERLNNLIRERRAARAPGAEHERSVKEISKDVQKELRAIRRGRKHDAINRALDQAKSLKRITVPGNVKQKALLSSVKSCTGAVCRDRQGIADTFADFYKELYDTIHQQRQDSMTDDDGDRTIQRGRNPERNQIAEEEQSST